MIRAFITLTEDLKSRAINPRLHFMDNEELKALKTTMTTMGIKYQLSPPQEITEKNSDRDIQTFKNHFIAGLYRVDNYLHIKL